MIHTVLPVEIFLECLSFLSSVDVSVLTRVCRGWRVSCEDRYLWKSIVASSKISKIKYFLNRKRMNCNQLHPKTLFFELKKLSDSVCIDLLSPSSGYKQSSVDEDNQTIANTLVSNCMFWSSTGSESPDHNEFLIYKFRHPLCIVDDVIVTVYQADFQLGSPIYAPLRIRLSVGYKPDSMKFTIGEFPMENSCEPVILKFAPRLVRGGYLRVDLLGRHQVQESDDQYYCCLKQVQARGHVIGQKGCATLNNVLITDAFNEGAFEETKEDPDEFDPDSRYNMSWRPTLEGISQQLESHAENVLRKSKNVFKTLNSYLELLEKLKSDMPNGRPSEEIWSEVAEQFSKFTTTEILNSVGLRNLVYEKIKLVGADLMSPYLNEMVRHLPFDFKMTRRESLGCGELFVSSDDEQLLSRAFRLRKIECFTELGDLVVDHDKDFALRIYVNAAAHQKVAEILFEEHRYEMMISYAERNEMNLDYAVYLKRLASQVRPHYAVSFARVLTRVNGATGQVDSLLDPRQICEILGVNTPEGATQEELLNLIYVLCGHRRNLP